MSLIAQDIILLEKVAKNYSEINQQSSESKLKNRLPIFFHKDQREEIAMSIQESALCESFEQRILNTAERIKEANARLFQLPDVLKDICKAIRELGFDFSAIQLIRPEDQTIGAVYADGSAKKWVGRARHYLDPDPELRDIQADIAQTCRTEIIYGWDKRFDKGVYDAYHHERLSRIFAPILVVLDEKGKVDQDWFNKDWKKGESWRRDDNSQERHEIIELLLPDFQDKEEDIEIKVLGTIEAGYDDGRKIEVGQAVKLLKLATEKASKLNKTRLPCILETIAENVMKGVEADSTSLHFLITSNPKRYIHKVSAGDIVKRDLAVNSDSFPYIYTVFSGKIDRNFLRDYPPRRNGLGRKAIRSGELETISDPEEMEKSNFNVFNEEVKAMAAYPLNVDHQQGVLYISYQREHQFTENEKRWIEVLGNRAADAIRQAMAHERVQNREDQLVALHAVAKDIAEIPDKKKLLHEIASNVQNILSADVVTIYEYINAEGKFFGEQAIAGKLKKSNSSKCSTEVEETDVPFKLIEKGKNVYALRAEKRKIFQGSSFTKDEKIKSVAGILLKVGSRSNQESNQEEIVGVMFVNYRRLHPFFKEEKQIIDILASSAAIAIKNLRQMSTLSDIDREIVNTLDEKELLEKIIQKAVELANARVGDILLLEAGSNELVVKEQHPKDVESDTQYERIPLGQGVTGWVAEKRKELLIPDVKADLSDIADGLYYLPYYPDTCSELCVPLIGKNGQILGVINVERPEKDVFNRRHLGMLKALAYQAVIVIENINSKEQLIKTKTFAAIGDLYTNMIHDIVSKLKIIGANVGNIIEKGDSYSKNKAEQIKLDLNAIFDRSKQIKEAQRDNEDLQAINLDEMFEIILSQQQLPRSNISIIKNLPGGLPHVWEHKQQLNDIFNHLIQNAVEAIPPNGGKIHLGAKLMEEKNEILVWVKDTGIGIPKDKQEDIFLPYYSTKDKDTWLRGFGLWWVKNYIERQGGSVTVDSEPNNGAKFTVSLRIANRQKQP